MPVKSPEIIEVLDLPKAELPQTPIENKIEIAISKTEVELKIEQENQEIDIVMPVEDRPVEVHVTDKTEIPAGLPEMKVSALSLKSIRAKKELEMTSKAATKDEAALPTEAFNETDMLLQWTKYAQRLSDRGQKIMESLLLINDPKLKGTTIIHELPNEGSKIDFEAGKHELLGYLRGKLHNHDIDIKTVVNESIDSRKAFTPQDRFNRLNEINPSLELLRKTFDLDF